MSVAGGDSAAAALDDPQQQQRKALGLLVRVCAVLEPASAHDDPSAAFAGRALPLLLTAQPGGVRLAAAVRAALAAWAADATAACIAAAGDGGDAAAEGRRAPSKGAAGDAGLAAAACFRRERLAEAWAALQLLPHACEGLPQALQLCAHARDAAQQACSLLPAAGAAVVGPADQRAGEEHDALRQGLLCLHGTATRMLAGLYGAIIEQAADPQHAQHAQRAQHRRALCQAAEAGVAWMRAHPGSSAAARGAAAAVQAARRHAADAPGARQLLSVDRLRVSAPLGMCLYPFACLFSLNGLRGSCSRWTGSG